MNCPRKDLIFPHLLSILILGAGLVILLKNIFSRDPSGRESPASKGILAHHHSNTQVYEKNQAGANCSS